MIRIRITMLAMLVMFSVSAVTAVTARAEEGKFIKAGSKTKELEKKGFKGVNSGSTTLETEKLFSTVVCKKLEGVGKQTGTETGEQTVKFKECTLSINGASCEGGKGHAAKEIVTETLTHTRQLKGRTEGVLEVEARAEGGGVGAFKFSCGSEKIEVKGSFLTSKIGLNSAAEKFTFETKQSKGKQENKDAEEESGTIKVDSLETKINSGAFEKSGQGGKEEITFEEKAELVK